MSDVSHSPSASQSSPHSTTSQFSKSASTGHSEASTGTKSQPHGWNVGRGVGSGVVGMAVVGEDVGSGVGDVDGAGVVGAGVGHRADVRERVRDHKVDVEKRVASLPQLLDHRRAPRQIWDEVAVHDVDVQRVGPGVHDLCGNQPVSLRILDAIESKLDFHTVQ